MKRLNQELNDILGGAVTYISEYAKKNNISLPNKNEINRMVGRIHILMDKIDKPYQTPKLTNNVCLRCNYDCVSNPGVNF